MATPAPAPPSLASTSIGQILNLLSSPGQIVGATPGHTVSQAGARAASQGAANNAVANSNNVYGQASDAVLARDPGIQQGYANDTAAIQANARQRAIADQAMLTQNGQDAAQAAAAFGITGAIPTTTARTLNTVAANQGAYQRNADAWQGFNNSKAATSVAANNAVSDAFKYQNAQEQGSIARLLQTALANEQDKYVKGSAGKLVGAPTLAQQLSGYGTLLGFSNKDATQNLNTQKFKASTAQKAQQQKIANSKAKALGFVF